MTSLILIVVALGAFVAVALPMWLLGRALAAVPEEDRAYKDPPPPGFRIVWWPIQWVTFYTRALVSAKSRDRLMVKLREAGLDYCLSPAQFVASRLVAALVAASLAWWVLDSFASGSGSSGSSFGWSVTLQVMLMAAMLGWIYPALWLKDRLATRRKELLKSLPFYLDIVTLCVEAGLNLQGALQQSVAKGPPGILRDEMQRVLRDIRAGKPRAEALRGLAQRLNTPAVGNFTSAVIQAEAMGMNLGPVLRAQADQRRSERFLRAEKLAMEAPVKMLFPLIAFIFPCTFIVLFFPIVMKFMSSGL